MATVVGQGEDGMFPIARRVAKDRGPHRRPVVPATVFRDAFGSLNVGGPTGHTYCMTMSEVSSLAEAKAHLSELVARVGDQHERITITVPGRPATVLLAVDDLESLEETIAVLSNAAAFMPLPRPMLS